MNLLYYLAEANIYLGVFYLAYCVLFTKETYYQLNRIYLLFSCVAAFALPVLQIGALKPVEAVVTTTINYTIPQDMEPIPVGNYINTTPVVIEHHLTMQDYLWYAYLLGAGILLMLLFIKLIGLAKLMRNAQTVNELKCKLVYLPETGVAFSFFNYLFLGDNAPGGNTIIRHELVHIRQKHSYDIIFLEILKVINWFNPFLYLLQNSLKTVHEYIADEQTAALETDAFTYSTFLVNNAYGTGGPAFTHSFFNYNLLKKRIIMLNRERSGKTAQLKYLVVLPLFAGLLCTSTLAFSKTYGWVDLDPAKPVKHESSRIIPIPQDFGKVKIPSLLGVKAKLIILDGKIIHPGPDETVSADSMTDVPENTAWAIKKWGNRAKNGVRIFSGHGAIIKKSESPLTPRNQFGGRMCGSSHNAQLPITQMLKTDPGLLFIVDGKKYAIDKSQLNDKTLISLTCDSMTVYDKGNEYAKSTWGNDVGQVVVLKGHAEAKLFNWPDAKKQTSTSTPDADKLLSVDFVNYLSNNVKFPNYPLNDNFVLTLNTSFTIANNKVTDIAMVINPDNKIAYVKKPVVPVLSDDQLQSFETEIIKGMQNAPTDAIKPGKYTLPVVFFFAKNKDLLDVANRIMAKNATGSLYFLSVPVIRAVINTSGDDTPPQQPDWEKFGKYFGEHVLYPSADRKNLVSGRVITIFAVDANHNLQYAKVVRTPSDAMADEVIKVLKKCTELNMLKPGTQYTLPINYTLASEDGKDGESLPESQINPKDHDPNSGIYNPGNIKISLDTPGLMLGDIVIRGYVKK